MIASGKTILVPGVYDVCRRDCAAAGAVFYATGGGIAQSRAYPIWGDQPGTDHRTS